MNKKFIIENGVLKKYNGRGANVIIPDSVISISTFSFAGCKRLTSVIIPDSVMSIGYGAFISCTGLTTVIIPNSVISIGSGAFGGCDSLQYNEYDNGLYLGNADNPYIVLVMAKTRDITSCIINAKTKIICSSAFFNCSKLTSIIIPDDVTSIGNFAFEGCTGLTNVTIGSSVSSIGDCAFWGCSGLTSINIPNSVTSVGNDAFCNCSGLTSVIMGNGVTNIGGNAFSSCSSLTSIIIPDSVTSIGDCAFYKRNKLTLPVGIKKIKAVKGFSLQNGKLKCRDFNFKIGEKYKENSASLCSCGFHACTNGTDVFNYYSGSGVAYYEVELSGISPDRGDDSKICGTTIKLLRKLTVAEAANYRSPIKEGK